MNLNRRVEMVFWSDTEGKLYPLKFRVEAEEDKITCKILNSVLVEENRISGNRVLVYRAAIENRGKRQEVRLIYEIDGHIWSVQY